MCTEWCKNEKPILSEYAGKTYKKFMLLLVYCKVVLYSYMIYCTIILQLCCLLLNSPIVKHHYRKSVLYIEVPSSTITHCIMNALMLPLLYQRHVPSERFFHPLQFRTATGESIGKKFKWAYDDHRAIQLWFKQIWSVWISFDSIVDFVKEQYSPKPSVVVVWCFKLNLRLQQPG